MADGPRFERHLIAGERAIIESRAKLWRFSKRLIRPTFPSRVLARKRPRRQSPRRSLVDPWLTLSRWQRCHSRRACQEYGPPPRGYQRPMFRSSSLTASAEAVIPYRFGPAFLASECWRLADHQATGSGWSILSA